MRVFGRIVGHLGSDLALLLGLVLVVGQYGFDRGRRLMH